MFAKTVIALSTQGWSGRVWRAKSTASFAIIPFPIFIVLLLAEENSSSPSVPQKERFRRQRLDPMPIEIFTVTQHKTQTIITQNKLPIVAAERSLGHYFEVQHFPLFLASFVSSLFASFLLRGLPRSILRSAAPTNDLRSDDTIDTLARRTTNEPPTKNPNKKSTKQPLQVRTKKTQLADGRRTNRTHNSRKRSAQKRKIELFDN